MSKLNALAMGYKKSFPVTINKSKSALIKNKRRKVQVKLGGAIAGFVVILVLLLQTYQVWDKNEIEKYKFDNNIKEIYKKAYDEGCKKAEKEWKPEMLSIGL